MRRVAWLVLLLALLPAAAPASSPTRATLSDLIEDAELIAVGRVVAREGDPRTFGFAQHLLEIERVLAGDAPASAPRLLGHRKVTYDLETGEIVGHRVRTTAVEWREGERLIAFLQRTDERDTWRVHPHGVRRLQPGDLEHYAAKITESLGIRRLPDGAERMDAQRAWALSLLDHSATLRDAALELLVGFGSVFDAPPRLGEPSEPERRLILEALLRHAIPRSWDGDPVTLTLIALVDDVPSEPLDRGLAALASHPQALDPTQRARHATLLAERLDDDELRELARSFTQLADSPRARSTDPTERGAWRVELTEHCWEFSSAAHASIQRFHR